jgi:hypothetical protein
LRPSRPSRETSSLASHINNITLSICASIRTTAKLLTLFFSFPSFYERQTRCPPTPPRSKPLARLDAKPQRPKDAKAIHPADGRVRNELICAWRGFPLY